MSYSLRFRRTALLLAAALTSTATLAAAPIQFRDASDELSSFVHQGSQTESSDGLSGVAVFDFNNDGWLDLFIANGKEGPEGLMRNQGDGTFENVSASAGFVDSFGSAGVAAGDMDNDGDEDLVVVGESGAFAGPASTSVIRLYRNELIELGTETFTDVTAGSGLVIPAVDGAGMAAVLGDIDRDGLVDLFVTAPASLADQGAGLPQPSNHLFANLGGLQFEDISAGSEVDYAAASCVAAFSHYDSDGLIDLLIGDCNFAIPLPFPPFLLPLPGALRLYTNDGDRTFTRRTDVGLPDPNVEGTVGFWMSLTTGDIDNDGRFDLFGTNFGSTIAQPHKMYRQLPNGSYRSVDRLIGLETLAPEFGWGGTFEDFNNDGWNDLFFAGNFPIAAGNLIDNPGYVLNNQGGTGFDVTGLDPSVLVGKYSTGVASGDLDNDGYVDLVVSNTSYFLDDVPLYEDGHPSLLMNMGNDDANNWVTLKLVGTTSNRSAIGAVIEVKAGSLRQRKEVSGGGGFLSRNSTWATFGLGQNTAIDRVVVRWPSGGVEAFTDVPINGTVTLVEGSAP